jgi:glycosyltransferase involved in cell wall biosynthesis
MILQAKEKRSVMKKVLIVTTISGFVPQFEMNNVAILQKLGYEVHYASNYNTPVYRNNDRLIGSNIVKHQVDFMRSPYMINAGIKAYHQLKNIMLQYKFDVVHIHTPVGGLIGRLVCRNLKVKPKVIYTAHGFHFYKGAALTNWLFFYPIEKYLSKFTDTLITINKEDYLLAKRSFRMKNLGYFFEPGFDFNKYNRKSCNRDEKRKELGMADEFVLLTVGELNKNKNQEIIIKALFRLKKLNIKYLLCGDGYNKNHLINICKKYGIEDKVIFLGYRNDIDEILQSSDCYIMSSIREGFGCAVIEAMAAGLPIINANNRGAREYAQDQITGFTCKYNNAKEFANAIQRLYDNPDMRKEMADNNINIAKKYDYSNMGPFMENIYSSTL